MNTIPEFNSQGPVCGPGLCFDERHQPAITAR